MTDTKRELKDIGASAMSSIRDMVAALECDYDRLEELRDERDDYQHLEDNDEPAITPMAKLWAEANPDEAKELASLEADAGDCTNQDEARERIQEDPLSIEFRSGWTTDRQEFSWDESMILLTTGGPAVRIMVELENGQPERAYMQVQDWGTPWTDYHEEGIGETLMTYVNVFCWE